MERETKEQKEIREQLKRDTEAFLKAGGSIQHLDNGQTDYAKSGLDAFRNQKRRGVMHEAKTAINKEI